MKRVVHMFGSKRNSNVVVSNKVSLLGRRTPVWDQASVRPATEFEIRAHDIDSSAAIGRMRANAVGSVGAGAMDVQATIAARERAIVGMEAGAIHGVAYLGQKITLGLGSVLDAAIEDVCSS